MKGQTKLMQGQQRGIAYRIEELTAHANPGSVDALLKIMQTAENSVSGGPLPSVAVLAYPPHLVRNATIDDPSPPLTPGDYDVMFCVAQSKSYQELTGVTSAELFKELTGIAPGMVNRLDAPAGTIATGTLSSMSVASKALNDAFDVIGRHVKDRDPIPWGPLTNWLTSMTGRTMMVTGNRGELGIRMLEGFLLTAAAQEAIANYMEDSADGQGAPDAVHPSFLRDLRMRPLFYTDVDDQTWVWVPDNNKAWSWVHVAP